MVSARCVFRAISPIGGDYRCIHDIVSKWAQGENIKGIALNYPPLSLLIFSPMLLFPLNAGYFVSVCLTLICFIGVIIWTQRHTGENLKEAWPLVLIPGLMSYGLQFELERGQFNVVAVALTVASLAVYHYGGGKRQFWKTVLHISCSVARSR